MNPQAAAPASTIFFLMEGCWGLNCVPRKGYCQVLTLVPVRRWPYLETRSSQVPGIPRR